MSEVLNSAPNVEPSSVHQEAGQFNKAIAAAGVGVLLVGGAAIYGFNHNSGDAKEQATAANQANECNSLAFTNAGADAVKYGSESFLPRNAVSGPADVQPYISGKKGLFSKTGPLAGNGDKASMAAITAVITDRATNKQAAIDPNYSYTDHFKRAEASFSGTNGVEAAKVACEKTYDALTQIPNFTRDWAAKGEKLTQFVAVRNKANEIVGMKLQKKLASEVMSGIEFKYSSSAKGEVVAGFPSVLETPDGELFVKGYAPEDGGKDKHGNPTKKDDNKNAGSTVGPKTGTAPRGTNNEQQGCGASGHTNCGGGSGTNHGGNGSGSGSGGSNGGGSHPTTPTPTYPPKTPPTYPPTTPPTYPPTTPPTTPPPTHPPKGTEPPCVPNPPYVIC